VAPVEWKSETVRAGDRAALRVVEPGRPGLAGVCNLRVTRLRGRETPVGEFLHRHLRGAFGL
jgi:hypothetical protein